MLKRIGIIGDSIAHGFYDAEDLGWVARLGKMMLRAYSGRYVFSNMAQYGDNVADAYHRALNEVSSRKFDLIILNIGINDLRRRKNSDLQLDFSEGARIMYWEKLLEFLQSTGAEIVVADLLPVVEEKYTEDASLIRYNSDVVRYNEIIKDICAEYKILFFARYGRWKVRDLDSLYQDATHPNAEGHQLLAEEIFEFLQTNSLL
ncbi:MAG: SGNH/GDSL hydrolase family protein [Alphaproteobacteria bacterium]|nr:SGNH/GDSL hydrolase family protein [Alphaproteobacteria bacterium]